MAKVHFYKADSEEGKIVTLRKGIFKDPVQDGLQFVFAKACKPEKKSCRPDIKTGDKIVVCSSLKDALCLWANTSIPAIAIQGEGYGISDTAINELKRRYKEVYILLDNDEAGLRDGEKLSASTGFINLVLPNINGAKDVSDLYKSLENKKRFKDIILNLFNNHQQNGNS